MKAVIKLLLETGKVDVDSKDKGGRAWAARNGHEAAVKLLLEKGVDVESKDQRGRTPLLWAARGHEAVVEMPLEKGVVTG
jgi:ankyrin repeat protein